MGNVKGRAKKRKSGGSQAAGHLPGQPAPSPASRRRRAIKWLAGIAAAGVTAFVVAYFTSIGTHVAALSTARHPGAAAGAPVRIDLVALEPGPSQSAVFPGPVTLSAAQLAGLNSINETAPAFQQWFTSRGAVAADNRLIELVVEGNRDSTVRIVGIQPVVSCRAPLDGTLFYSPAAGSETITQIILDLDNPLAPQRYIVNANGQTSDGTDFFGHFTVALAHGEQYTFTINASTTDQYCQFTLDMTVLDGTRTVTEPVSNHGKPFAVTAIYNENDLNPGAFSRYPALYVGGIAATGQSGSGRNQYGDPLWLSASPAAYRQ